MSSATWTERKAGVVVGWEVSRVPGLAAPPHPEGLVQPSSCLQPLTTCKLDAGKHFEREKKQFIHTPSKCCDLRTLTALAAVIHNVLLGSSDV